MHLQDTPLWLGDGSGPPDFPPVQQALEEPNGLLGIGGSLSPEWLLKAYHNGIFPWFGPDEPILWWSPNPRMVLFPKRLKIRRSLAKRIRNGCFCVTLDSDFGATIRACATGHGGETWITTDMIAAYEALHASGHAHSVEVWQGSQLVGGLYGVAVGRTFFGESMFSRVNDSSKIALAMLTEELERRQFTMIDCQMHTTHLASLGAELITRQDFITHVQAGLSAGQQEGMAQQQPLNARETGAERSWHAILLTPH